MVKKIILAVGICAVMTVPVNAEKMAHWANLRDDTGNVIGTVGEGSCVQIIGQCSSDPTRTTIYDPCTGCYGTVSTVYIYGGTEEQYENPYAGTCATYNYDYTEQNGCGQSYGYDYEYSYEYGYGQRIYDGYVVNGQDNIYSEEWDTAVSYEGYDYSYGYENYQAEDDGTFVFYQPDEIWVDVDISAQTVNIYQGNTIIMSGACVTGTAGVSDTPVGTYYIGGKTEDAVLCGADYECPVDYWMPFCGGCGFHDASWRDSYGGDIYEYDGSHGCVNLDSNFAEEMYETVSEGTKVVVHGNG